MKLKPILLKREGLPLVALWDVDECRRWGLILPDGLVSHARTSAWRWMPSDGDPWVTTQQARTLDAMSFDPPELCPSHWRIPKAIDRREVPAPQASRATNATARLLVIGKAVEDGIGAPSLNELGWTFEDGWAAAIAHLRSLGACSTNPSPHHPSVQP